MPDRSRAEPLHLHAAGAQAGAVRARDDVHVGKHYVGTLDRSYPTPPRAALGYERERVGPSLYRPRRKHHWRVIALATGHARFTP